MPSRAGATMSTHLGNGAHACCRRHPNYIWEQLAEDRLRPASSWTGSICRASFLKVALRAKGVDRSVLVTDASSPAGCPPGRYRLGEQEVDLTPDNRVVLAGQDRLAGSALRMDRGVENLMRFAGFTLAQAVQLATINPAAGGPGAGADKGLAAGRACRPGCVPLSTRAEKHRGPRYIRRREEIVRKSRRHTIAGIRGFAVERRAACASRTRPLSKPLSWFTAALRRGSLSLPAPARPSDESPGRHSGT